MVILFMKCLQIRPHRPLLAVRKEGRKEVCHARDSQNWLIRVKSSALVTGFVLAEGTHQTRYLFGELHSI